MKRFFRLGMSLLVTLLLVSPVSAQWTALQRGTKNISVEGHLPLGPRLSVMDIELEQEMSRPYAYVGRGTLEAVGAKGMDIIDLSDPTDPRVLLRWRIEDEELHTGLGGMDVKYFKWKGRYYVVQSTQFGPGPDSDLGAVIFDTTGLPDPNSVTEVARIYEPDLPGGFHNIFIYKHSSGRVLLLTTVNGGQANMYDLGMIVEGDRENALVGTVPVVAPEGAGGPMPFQFYHDLYAAWHPDTGQDRFYGGGTGGYYVFDITDLENPHLEITIVGVSGVPWGHTFTPSPDGRYAIGEVEYQYAPLRIFDMKPALDGEQTNIRRAISAWTANWKNLVHNHEVRWPYVFVSGYQDGLQIFSLLDPKNPRTVGYYDTYTGPEDDGVMGGGVGNGAFGVDVRNEDGLIVISDLSTGLWTFRMEGFNGWNGEDWGMPDISSVQKWDEESKEETN
ncbi:MAG: hypothetical protein IH951_13990 [Bacteroidetes bacterium]|nr:hypothetical protein [Bacteroidota bacterium]